MDAIFRKEGQSLDYTPVSAVSAGDVIALQNNFYGIAKLDIAANELGALAVNGIYQMAKPAGVINFGAILYWNAGTKQVQTTPIDNAYCGRAAAAAADADETVLVAVNACNIGSVSAPEAQAAPAVTQNAIAALTATDPTCDAADPSITAVDPAEMTAADPTVVDPVTETITGSDYTGQAAIIKLAIEANTTAVKAVEAEVEKLIDDVTAIRTQLVAAIADLATLRDSDKAIIDDVQAIETSLEAGIDDLGTLKTAVNAAKTDLATAVTALTTAGLFE
jgi:predicted RecA/RadA family phage recombinase